MTAAAAVVPFVPGALSLRPAAEDAAVTWRGTALGAEASLTIHHPDAARARRLAEACIDEVARLEAIFSLHGAESEISRLNRTGRLEAPSPELRALLAECRVQHALTANIFDPTVQPLWDAHAAAAERGRAASRREIADAIALVGLDAVDFDRSAVRVRRAGTKITLNGIAQGFVTDRIADLLRDAGMVSVLVALGEIRALGPRAGGWPWRIGLRNPAYGGVDSSLALATGAIASSGAYGTRLDPILGTHHLFDPRTGATPEPVAAISVLAPRATAADALSTALAVAPSLATPALLRRAGASAVLRFEHDGRVLRIEADRHMVSSPT